MVRVDQTNPSLWDTSPTSNWQWIPAVDMHYSDTPLSVTCVVANRPYQTNPTFTSSWQTTKTVNMVDTKAIK
eukprot:10035880-Ditylum_brightwellii.AAC.1